MLAAALPHCEQLKELYLGNNVNMRDYGVERLCEHLPKCDKLRILDMSSGGISGSVVWKLAWSLPKSMRVFSLAK